MSFGIPSRSFSSTSPPPFQHLVSLFPYDCFVPRELKHPPVGCCRRFFSLTAADISLVFMFATINGPLVSIISVIGHVGNKRRPSVARSDSPPTRKRFKPKLKCSSRASFYLPISKVVNFTGPTLPCTLLIHTYVCGLSLFDGHLHILLEEW